MPAALIKAVIFDLDGVVVDSEPLYQQAEDRLFREEGIAIPAEDWKLFRGASEERFYQLARERYGVTTAVDELRRRGQEYIFSVFETGLDFMAGFLDLHRQLRGHYKLGLVTSTPEAIYNWMAAHLGLNRFFKEVIYGGMTTHAKPHPEPYLEMLRRLDVAAEEAVVVEDSIHGLTSALASGVWTVALTGSVPEEDMPPAHAVVHSLKSLSPAFFAGLEPGPLSAVPSQPAGGSMA